MLRLKKDLSKETDERLKLALDRAVAKMNKHRLRVDDISVGHYLEAEMDATEIGNEIKSRKAKINA